MFDKMKDFEKKFNFDKIKDLKKVRTVKKEKSINKSQMVLYISALMLVTAGYWSYISKEAETVEVVSNIGQSIEEKEQKSNEEERAQESKTQNANEIENKKIEETTADENIGDATLVSTNVIENEEKEILNNKSNENIVNTNIQQNKTDDYFENSRLDRNTMYSKSFETYKEMLNNTNVSEEQKAIISQEITKLTEEQNSIMIAENLIKTKGFEDVIIFINIDSISVIIKAKELSQTEIAQIQNIISRELKAEIENIHIMTK